MFAFLLCGLRISALLFLLYNSSYSRLVVVVVVVVVLCSRRCYHCRQLRRAGRWRHRPRQTSHSTGGGDYNGGRDDTDRDTTRGRAGARVSAIVSCDV